MLGHITYLLAASPAERSDRLYMYVTLKNLQTIYDAVSGGGVCGKSGSPYNSLN